ncbi:sugar-binding transcriptional regulator [Metabacillus fastidiosus]|uniref:sugar-binding transcriptional regulator n=1 Tax=Metabacillus fastidiosus TaxID=1458 RepID=UPI002E1FF83F|nr:sugar-binding domain-containing protein [Metabacillus fastidiosus]MED4454367.1 sugar-binding domain-containing protein [Metabacillus fastidiosus]
MRSLLDVQSKLLPDLLNVMQKRYEILRYIRLMQPIGRRSLANSLGITERILRNEVLFLKDQNLIDIRTSGMTLTEDGTSLLKDLEEMMPDVLGLAFLENTLKEKFNLDEVIVVSGDSDLSPWVKKEMGRACVTCIKSRLAAKNIVAVTGGTTLAAVAEMMTPDSKNRELMFVPARGGLAENVENQANTICAKMAGRAMGNYRLLHVPDQLSREAYQSIIEEPYIKELLATVKSSSMVIYGIGDARTMARRRRTPAEDFKKIEEGKAVAEAFGYYFNEEGEVVHKVQTVGIQLEDIRSILHVIAVAGGASKAKAIRAYMKQAVDSVLITDEGAAKELIRAF